MSENKVINEDAEQESKGGSDQNGADQNGGRFKKPDNWFLVLFIAVLAVPYIRYAHKTDGKIRELDKLSKEVKELRSEYVTLKSEIVSKNKQSDIVEKLESSDLKPLETAPYSIEKEK